MALEILREIHAPGLDLNEQRLQKHRIFMDLMHEIVDSVAAWGWAHYLQEGRGALYVNPDEWFEMISRSPGSSQEANLNSFYYLPLGHRHKRKDVERLGAGYPEMLAEYDPVTMLVLVVNHESDFLSCYLAKPTLAPRDVYESRPGTV